MPQDHNVEIRGVGIHTDEEILAESICQAQAIASNQIGIGWIYAVGRQCGTGDTCDQICKSAQLHIQDTQTSDETWKCISAMHVYTGRPVTNPNGQRLTATLGLKVFLYRNSCSEATCGPNFLLRGFLVANLSA